MPRWETFQGVIGAGHRRRRDGSRPLNLVPSSPCHPAHRWLFQVFSKRRDATCHERGASGSFRRLSLRAHPIRYSLARTAGFCGRRDDPAVLHHAHHRCCRRQGRRRKRHVAIAAPWRQRSVRRSAAGSPRDLGLEDHLLCNLCGRGDAGHDVSVAGGKPMRWTAASRATGPALATMALGLKRAEMCWRRATRRNVRSPDPHPNWPSSRSLRSSCSYDRVHDGASLLNLRLFLRAQFTADALEVLLALRPTAPCSSCRSTSDR